MADVARCQNKLASFRIRELKDVLTRLGLPKQGKKQILMDKIMGLIIATEKQPVTKGPKGSKKNVVTREEAINIIDEAYRLLRSSGADLVAGGKHKSAKSGSSSGYPSVGPEEPAGRDESKTRCPCGNSVDMGTMIQCDEPRCRVWQHMNCVVISEKPINGVQPDIPPNFYCELCRISRGDPFCVALSHPLLPTKMSSPTIQADSSNTLQSVEKSFTLTRADQDLLHKPNHDLQVWCVLMSDKVSFRMHWPPYADLRVNGVSVRVTNRPGQQLLGANGRDEGPGITACTREGLNRITMSAYDARPFCIGVRVIRRCSLQQVLDMIPSEKDGEPYEEAMARVCRCIGGGQGLGADDDDDSDLEVVADSITVNLRCPMSGSRIKVAGRFKLCLHMGCFDLDTFVELNQRSRKWQCPICLKNYSIEALVVDPFFNRITHAVKSMSEDITEVELKADGSWRPKLEGDARFREPWRSTGSAVVVPVDSEHRSVLAPLPTAVKVEEGLSSHEKGSLRLGIKRTAEGVWAVNGANHMNGGPSIQKKKKQRTLPAISKSSSATDTNIGGEDEQSVNQDPSEDVMELPEENDEVMFPAKPVAPPEGVWQSSGGEAPNGANVIVLSDTDDENGDDPVVGSSGGSVHGGSDTRDNSQARSAEASLQNDTHGDSSGPALVTDSVDAIMGVSSQALTLDPLVSTGVTMDMTDKATSNCGGLGSQKEINNFWSVLDHVPKCIVDYFETFADPGVSRHPPPVRPTPVQAVAGSGFLPSSLVSDDSRPSSGWMKFSRPLPTVTYVNNNDGGSNDSGRTASPTERQFMLPEPVRVEMQSSFRVPVVPEDNIDNSWFSLRLGGGGESAIEEVPTRIPTSSNERRAAPTSQPETSAALPTANSNGVTTHVRQSDSSKVHGRSHTSGAGYIVPSRPRSSPLHVRRPYRHFRVDDWDTE